MIGKSLEGTPNQKVSRRKRFNAVIIVVGNSAQRAAVEASFDLSKHSAHFFKIQFGISYDASQMNFKAIHGSLHNPPK